MLKIARWRTTLLSQAKLYLAILGGISLLTLSQSGFAQVQSLDALNIATNAGSGQTYSLSLQTLIVLTSLAFLPTVLLMMTSFARIVIVLSFLRQALGVPTAPSN
jgi:flagellar biosynthetic protein FliP